MLERVRSVAEGVQGVRRVQAVTGRSHGSDVLVQLGIEVDPDTSVARGVSIAEDVRRAIYTNVPEVGDAMVELNTDHLERIQARLQ
jgi:divalent metal cation (Fe/Co/Zn/Cd) transporter